MASWGNRLFTLVGRLLLAKNQGICTPVSDLGLLKVRQILTSLQILTSFSDPRCCCPRAHASAPGYGFGVQRGVPFPAVPWQPLIPCLWRWQRGHATSICRRILLNLFPPVLLVLKGIYAHDYCFFPGGLSKWKFLWRWQRGHTRTPVQGWKLKPRMIFWYGLAIVCGHQPPRCRLSQSAASSKQIPPSESLRAL